MKKLGLFVLISMLVIAACQPKVKTVAVNLDAVVDTINKMADEYQQAVVARDIDVLTSILSDDGLFCGTDPSEIFDKQALLDYYKAMALDTLIDYKYKVDVRKIRVSDDGTSGIVWEQITASGLTPSMGITQTYFVVKNNNKWEIDYVSWGFLMKNEYIPLVDNALTLEKDKEK